MLSPKWHAITSALRSLTVTLCGPFLLRGVRNSASSSSPSLSLTSCFLLTPLDGFFVTPLPLRMGGGALSLVLREDTPSFTAGVVTTDECPRLSDFRSLAELVRGRGLSSGALGVAMSRGFDKVLLVSMLAAVGRSVAVWVGLG